ncbi:MAG TPA: hypothetical protein VGH76_05280 [Actinomycetospora sp.]|jgi:hypothetical protein|uniref:hypothetical protein n=1 Tax=Actinomycetospora sp. TaxID=1872135 RepID=UPI002F3F8A51
MTEEPRQDQVLARLDELVALLRRVDRLEELVEVQGRAGRPRPLVGGDQDLAASPRRWDRPLDLDREDVPGCAIRQLPDPRESDAERLLGLRRADDAE